MEEAKDVFQQTMIIFYENIISEKLTDIKTQVKTYLFGIGKNKLHELLRDKNKQSAQFNDQIYVNTEYDYQDAEDAYEDQLKLVEVCLDELGDPCRRILGQYYYHRKTMLQISESLGYKNSETVKNLKYKCLQRLRQIVSKSMPL
jgi:RNA polymerase sigma-70 factor (ECF subfamily)